MLITRLFLTASFLLTITHCDIYSLWSSEHLDDLIMSDAYRESVPALTPAIIALYETQCSNQLRRIGFTDHSLPSPSYLLIAQYDRIKAQTETWYNFDSSSWDLFNRYNIDTTSNNKWCPTIIFQPANWSNPAVIYNPKIDGTFIDWTWKMLEINVKFTNNLPSKQKIYLSLEPEQNVNNIQNLNTELILAEIDFGDSTIVSLHVSDVIVVWNDKHEIINRITINSVDNEIAIDSVSKDPVIVNQDKFYEKRRNDDNFRKQRIWMTRRRYLFNTRVPPIIPKFTDLGFDHRKMPDEICEYLTEFYETNKNIARKESFPKDNPLINAHEVPMHMIHIPQRKKEWIGGIIKPLLEEWTGQKLRFSILYGLREYSKGAVLKGHCDKLETHVVSTILHLKHDPIDVPWPIEVYGFDKERHYLEDEPCTMTFYESSTLIHGRPSTYNGTSWVNAFLHFRPVEWDYKFTRDNFVITPNLKMPIYDPNKYG